MSASPLLQPSVLQLVPVSPFTQPIRSHLFETIRKFHSAKEKIKPLDRPTKDKRKERRAGGQEGRKAGGQEGRREGGKEGRREGGKEGRREGA